MTLAEIHEHTIDLDLLPEKALILDLGCRGFQFTDYFREFGHTVYPVDIDLFDRPYYQCAIAGYNGKAGILRGSDPQGTRITEGNDVPTYTLDRFSKHVGVDFWDVIKMDIEGSEMPVIMNMKEPLSKQLSIEFHLHCGFYSLPDVALMVAKLNSIGYKTIQHNKENRYGAGFNYWDSLFVLK